MFQIILLSDFKKAIRAYSSHNANFLGIRKFNFGCMVF